MWSRRIVLVDGHSDFRQLVSLLLRARRHEVVEAFDGATGLAAIAEERPDAVFVDLEISGPSAHELVDHVRSDPELGSVVLVALYGGDDPDEADRAIEAGFDVCLTAPTSADELEAALRTPVGMHQETAQPSMFDSAG